MLAAPWIMFQGVARRDASWKSGKPAKYLAKWIAWYRGFPELARSAYSMAFKEPKGWAGFYKSVTSVGEK
jgi:hypothetical protein